MVDWIRQLLESDGSSRSLVDPELRLMLRESLRECEALYRAGGRIAASDCPDRISGGPRKFVGLMLDLHRGLVVKILVEIGRCDRRWNPAEREVARLMLRHAWGTDVSDAQLAQALRNVADHADTLKWEALVEPFTRMPPLMDQIPELTALALRIANLVAKADGKIQPSEATALRNIEQQLEAALDAGRQDTPAGLRSRRGTGDPNSKRTGAVAQAVAVQRESKQSNAETREDDAEAPLTPVQRQQAFDDAMEELEQLIGLEPVKNDIRELVDFLKIQSQRRQHGLATAQVSLHTVFEGNPGTGKTTVARILGRLFCGLELLEKGHTIETDRSGLVAEYAGQTGPRTNQRVDEALHGVLFVDEAYSLVAEQGQDAFGVEAVQALLKRMEDDRERLIVVLAGYPQPMDRLLKSNPGLSSRFQRTFSFPDYSAKELLEIFRLICKNNHYRLTAETKQRLFTSFQHLIDDKDQHFGNGRLARNIFEQAIRRQATRLVNIAPLTRKLLTTLEPEDIDIDGVHDGVKAPATSDA